MGKPLKGRRNSSAVHYKSPEELSDALDAASFAKYAPGIFCVPGRPSSYSTSSSDFSQFVASSTRESRFCASCTAAPNKRPPVKCCLYFIRSFTEASGSC
jgi:hypothetical protein